MRLNTLLAFFLCFTFIYAASAQETDIIDEVTQNFRNVDSHGLSKYFASTVEFAILSEEEVYSKAQTELILKDFFAKHKPVSVKSLHRLDSNPNYRFGVFLMTTENGKFRISFSMKNTSGKFLITEISIKNNQE